MVDPHEPERRTQHRHRSAVLVDGESVLLRRAEIREQHTEADRVGAWRGSAPHPAEPAAQLWCGDRGRAHLRELPAHPGRHAPRLLAELALEDRPVGTDDALDI